MNARSSINLGLLGVVVTLLLLVVFEPGHDADPIPQPLLALNPDQVERIEVQQRGREAVRLERRDGAWRMIEPQAQPANTPLIEQILKIAGDTCPRRYAAAALEPSQLQLRPPLLRLVLNDRGLSFGGTEPLDGQRYVQSGDDVYLCTDRYYPLLSGDAASFVAPRTSAGADD